MKTPHFRCLVGLRGGKVGEARDFPPGPTFFFPLKSRGKLDGRKFLHPSRVHIHFYFLSLSFLHPSTFTFPNQTNLNKSYITNFLVVGVVGVVFPLKSSRHQNLCVDFTIFTFYCF